MKNTRQYNVICDRCGFQFKNHQLRKEPRTNLMVCDGPNTNHCWEPVHPQEFIRAKPDNHKLPYTRPEADLESTYSPTVGLINSLGDGTVTGKYTAITNEAGYTVYTVTIVIEIGSTTTFNAGAWTVSLPAANGNNVATGFAELLAKNKMYQGDMTVAAAASTASIKSLTDRQVWSDTIPQTFSEGDSLLITLRYSTE